jgi:hypothetical protein
MSGGSEIADSSAGPGVSGYLGSTGMYYPLNGGCHERPRFSAPARVTGMAMVEPPGDALVMRRH